MECDFTPLQVWKGEIEYTLDQFYEDFKEEVAYNFKKLPSKRLKDLIRLMYQVMYFFLVTGSKEGIQERLPYNAELIDLIIDNSKENVEMLKAIIIAKFLRNLKQSNGLLNESLNMELVNAELHHFHEEHNL